VGYKPDDRGDVGDTLSMDKILPSQAVLKSAIVPAKETNKFVGEREVRHPGPCGLTLASGKECMRHSNHGELQLGSDSGRTFRAHSAHMSSFQVDDLNAPLHKTGPAH
jgi:hypothetical protein